MEENKNMQNQNKPNSYWNRPLEEDGEFFAEEKNAGAEAEVGDNDSKKNKSRDNDIKKYKDQGGLTVRKLNVGLWYLEHKNLLRKILVGFLIFISAVSWPYVIYGFASYFSRGMVDDKTMADDIVNSGRIDHNAVISLSPKDLSFSSVSILPAGDNKYDFFTRVQNPNNRHGAEFVYYFSDGDKNTGSLSGFILPGETKYLLSLGNEFEHRPASSQLKIDGLKWITIDRHEISDWKDYSGRRLDIAVSGAKFTPAGQSGLSDKIKLNSLEFSALNNTVFNYWNVDFTILLYGGSNIVGVNRYSLDEFMSGQTRQASMSLPGELSQVNKIEVFPEINILRDDIYIEYEGGAGEIK
jgi:hypothetical protein